MGFVREQTAVCKTETFQLYAYFMFPFEKHHRKNTRWMGSDIGRVYFSLANERSVTHSCVRAIYHLIRIKQTPPPPPPPNTHPHSMEKSHSIDHICSASLLYLRSFHILAAVASTALHFDGEKLFIIRLHPIYSIQ